MQVPLVDNVTARSEFHHRAVRVAVRRTWLTLRPYSVLEGSEDVVAEDGDVIGARQWLSLRR